MSFSATVICVLCVSVISAVKDHDFERSPVTNPEHHISPIQEDGNWLDTYGYSAFEGQFPYHAEVLIKPISLSYVHTCAGSLITLKYVLTTAACLYRWVNEFGIEYSFVTLGTLFNGDTQWEQRINFTDDGIYIHPLYRCPSYELYNIATIRLDCPATLNRFVQPIRLPRLTDIRTCEMMEGTATGDSFVRGLKYLRNQVMSNEDCQRNILPGVVITVQHLCTNSFIGGVFCFREYGSSLTVEDENGRFLIGIADHVFWCSSKYPTRHVRVSYFLDWIQTNSDYILEL
uniref:Peptidase S1 domain-containing protein n=1 Tax=Anopheles quadriannulatus TaxID=34691 RepID=A0A904A496_ANOQN